MKALINSKKLSEKNTINCINTTANNNSTIIAIKTTNIKKPLVIIPRKPPDKLGKNYYDENYNSTTAKNTYSVNYINSAF